MDTRTAVDEAVQFKMQIDKVGGGISKAILYAALRFACKKIKEHHETGEQSLKTLNKSADTKNNVSVNSEDIHALRAELKQHKVDFAIKQDKETGNYTLFFKGKDVDTVKLGLQKSAKSFGSQIRMADQMNAAKEQSAVQQAAQAVGKTLDRVKSKALEH